MLEMVGAVIIAHSFVGKELIATAEYIVGKIEGLVAVSIDSETNGLLVEVVTDIIYENHIERFLEISKQKISSSYLQLKLLPIRPSLFFELGQFS